MSVLREMLDAGIEEVVVTKYKCKDPKCRKNFRHKERSRRSLQTLAYVSSM